jgi:hypothetical protein
VCSPSIRTTNALLDGNRAHLGARMDLSRILLGDPAEVALSAEELLRRTPLRSGI